MYYFITFVFFILFFHFYYSEIEYYFKEVKKELLWVMLMILFIMLVYPLKSISLTIMNILLILSLISIFFLLYQKKKMEIVAQQVTFWDIPVENILVKNKNQVVKKNNRNELVEQKEVYFYDEKDGKKKILPINLLSIKHYNNFTFINSIDEITNLSIVYNKIFDMIKKVAHDNESHINYQNALSNNKYCVEFLLLDCWEKICFDEIIGVGTLETVAIDDKDIALIYAIDAIKNSNVLKEGLMLYSHYLNFKKYKFRSV